MTPRLPSVTLQPIAMVRPNSKFIYAPSRLGKPKTIPYAEFLKRYANTAEALWVSFANDGVSDPKLVTAYGYGFDAWYIL